MEPVQSAERTVLGSSGPRLMLSRRPWQVGSLHPIMKELRRRVRAGTVGSRKFVSVVKAPILVSGYLTSVSIFRPAPDSGGEEMRCHLPLQNASMLREAVSWEISSVYR